MQCRGFHFMLAETFALLTDVVAEHGPEHEVLFGGEPVERLVRERTYRIQAGAFAEVEVHLAARYRLAEVLNDGAVRNPYKWGNYAGRIPISVP